MTPHVHAGVLEFVAFFAYLLIALFILRVVETTWPNSPLGKALLALHG